MAPCLDAYATGGGVLVWSVRPGGYVPRGAGRAGNDHQSPDRAGERLTRGERARPEDRRGAEKARRTAARGRPDLPRAGHHRCGAATGRAGEQVSQLQQQADQTQAALAQAEAEVRTLSPNYGQLVQDVVPASAVFAALHPGEAFVALFLSKNSGWAFAVA